MIIYLPDISKSNLPMKLWGDKMCITYYIYTYQLHCPKQDVLRTLIKMFYTFATEAKHTSVYALLLKQHPCCFWLDT